MNNTGLIITLGTRDIQVHKKALTQFPELEKIARNLTGRKQATEYFTFNSPRDGGEYLLSKYEEYREIIEYPITKPAIEFVHDKIESNSQLKIILVATDQEDEEFRQSDSIAFAEILQKKLEELYPGIRVELYSVQKDVAKLDRVFAKFSRDEELNKKLGELDKTCGNIYLFSQGGIDAINTALLLSCAVKFENQLQVIGLQEGEVECAEQSVADQFLTLFEIKQAKKLIERYDYAGIEYLDRIPKNVRDISKYASYRLQFNFEEASNIWNSASTKTFSDKKKWFEKINDSEEKIQELYWNAKIKYFTGDYVDFLGRLFGLVDNQLNIMVESIFRISTTKPNLDIQEANFADLIQEAFTKDSEFEKFMKEYKYNDSGLNLTGRESNTTINIAILEYYAQAKGLPYFNPELETNLLFYEKIKKLSNLRNKLIIAHGFNGISEKKFKKQLEDNGLNPDSFWEQLHTILGIKSEQNPFDEINEWLIARLDEIRYRYK